MRAITFLLFLVLSDVEAIAQGGYLGSRTGVELRVALCPSELRISKVKDNSAIARPRFVCAKTSLNITRVITRHAEISFGYELTPIRADMTGLFLEIDTFRFAPEMTGYDDYNSNLSGEWLIEYPVFNHHALSFEYNYFRKWNIAPVGSTMGFGIYGGSCKLKQGTEIVTGDIGYFQDRGVFRRENEIIYRNEYILPETQSFKTLNARIHFGQHIPISRKLIFTTRFTLPIFHYSTSSVAGPRATMSFLFYRYSYGAPGNDLIHIMPYSYGLYNLLTIDAGLRIML